MIGDPDIDLARAARVLRRSKAPIILVGPAARRAMEAVGDLAADLGAPVMTTPDAKSLFDETSPYAGGVFSFGASARSLAFADASDAVVAIGTNLGEFASQAGRAFGRVEIVLVVDDPHDLPVGLSVAATLVGDVAAAVRAIARRVGRRAPAERWFDRVAAPEDRRPVAAAPASQSAQGSKLGAAVSALAVECRDRPSRSAQVPKSRSIDPAAAVRALGDALPPRARVACDVTSAALHVLHDLKFQAGQRLCLQLERSACMGSALAAGLGIRLASGLPTLVVIGDWGLMTGGSELHTVACMGIGRFVVVVWSNCGGALIRAGVRAQDLDVPEHTHSWRPPSFERVASGYGVRALTVRTAKGLRRAAAAALRAPFPAVIDAIVDPDAAIPGARSRYAHLTASERPR